MNYFDYLCPMCPTVAHRHRVRPHPGIPTRKLRATKRRQAIAAALDTLKPPIDIALQNLCPHPAIVRPEITGAAGAAASALAQSSACCR